MRFVKLNSNRFLLTLFYSQLIGFAGISAGTFYVGSGVFNSHLFLIRLQENSWPSERGLKPVNAEKGNEHATIDWGSYPGQSIVTGRAAPERKPPSDLAKGRRQQPAHGKFPCLCPIAQPPHSKSRKSQHPCQLATSPPEPH